MYFPRLQQCEGSTEKLFLFMRLLLGGLYTFFDTQKNKFLWYCPFSTKHALKWGSVLFLEVFYSRLLCTKTAILFNDLAVWVEIRLTDCEQRLWYYKQWSIEHEELVELVTKGISVRSSLFSIWKTEKK